AFGRLLIVTAELHFAEDPFALHFLLQDAQRLIDVVFTNENLHFDRFLPCMRWRPGIVPGAIGRRRRYHRAEPLERGRKPRWDAYICPNEWRQYPGNRPRRPATGPPGRRHGVRGRVRRLDPGGPVGCRAEARIAGGRG